MLSRVWRLAGLSALAILLGGCGAADNGNGAAAVESGKSYRWRLITTWPKNLPGLGTGPERLAEMVDTMSNGRLQIKVYGAGELVGAFEVFDAVSAGTAEMGHGAAYYWRGKIPVAAMFATVPFGMTAQEQNAWLQYGGGMELWREAYAPFSLVPIACGNTGTQMAGWFNKEINGIEDLQGLRMRIPGLGGEVLKRAGGVPVAMPASDVFVSLQNNVIDATEWVGPYNDLALGLHTAARYYYYPGWHEPGAGLEAIVNQQAWDSLPKDLQTMLEVAARKVNDDMLSEFTARNTESLRLLVEEHDVELRALPDEVLAELARLSDEVVKDAIGDSDLSRRVYESYMTFLEQVKSYQRISEGAFVRARDTWN